jgi:hypothetical protein
MDEQKKEQKINGQGATPFAQFYFHGTKTALKVGDYYYFYISQLS